VRVLPEESYGAALNYFTGSKDHNIALRQLAVKKRYKLSEYGLFDGKKQIAGRPPTGLIGLFRDTRDVIRNRSFFSWWRWLLCTAVGNEASLGVGKLLLGEMAGLVEFCELT